MTCSDVRQVLPDIIDGEGDAEFQLHLKSCLGCAELVADLKLIASEAGQLAESEAPPDRVWVGIANQLRAEGIIREPEAGSAGPVLVPIPARRWNAWWLAPVAAAILAAGSYQLAHQQPAPNSQVAQFAMPSAGSQPAANPQTKLPVESAQTAPKVPPAGDRQEQLAKSRSLPPTRAMAENPKISENRKTGDQQRMRAEISPPASAEDEELLSEVSQRAPTMRSTYESQLRAVNAEIRETQQYIRRYPGDLDARQHLMEVFQQKAMLYQMALDRIQ
jgi:hypothetical protein